MESEKTPEQTQKSKKSSGCGCLVIVIILFIIVGMFEGCGDEKNNNAQNTSSKSEQQAQTAAQKQEQARKEREQLLSAPQLNYQEIARYPDKYKGQAIQIYGQVFLISESDKKIIMVINTKKSDYSNDYHGDGFVVEYKKNSIEARILRGDIIRVYGIFNGIEKYESALGEVSKLSISAKIVER